MVRDLADGAGRAAREAWGSGNPENVPWVGQESRKMWVWLSHSFSPSTSHPLVSPASSQIHTLSITAPFHPCSAQLLRL